MHNNCNGHTEVAFIGFDTGSAVAYITNIFGELLRYNLAANKRKYKIKFLSSHEVIPWLNRVSSKKEDSDDYIICIADDECKIGPYNDQQAKEIFHKLYMLRHIMKGKTIVAISFRSKESMHKWGKHAWHILAWNDDDEILSEEARVEMMGK
jgi:hypothetical protein